MTLKYSYKKPYRARKRKPILNKRFLWLSVLALIAANGLLYYLFFSDFFQIKDIRVTGQNTVAGADIESVVSGGNILLADVSQIQKNILNGFPVVAQANIRRILPSTLSIKITERLAAAVWCQERCFLIDADGAVFDKASAETDLIKISGEKGLLGRDMVDRIIELKAKLKEKSGVDVVTAFIASGERLNLKVSDGWKIYLNLKGDLDWQIQELSLVLEKQIPPEKIKNLEYVDLRFSRVYYKYK